ncbi:MAG: hypothetical protein EXQ53_12205 [Acidobacteria bacterium]|nr:hypothetical protein [Acidobacteriota bacterium]
MRILFFLHNVSKSRHFDGVIQLLAERGHTIVLAAARQRNRPLTLPKSLSLANRSLIARGLPGRIELTSCPVRRVDAWEQLAPALRHARDYLRFFDPRYAHATKLEQRSATHTPKGWLAFIEGHPWFARRSRLVSRALALAEQVIPTDPLFDLFIAYERPDLVLVTPLVDYGSYQTDYVKSAHRLGIPVVFAPFSWDNLTNRGLVRVQPDRVLVWNEIQQREAIDLHDVAAARVTVTGAPRFDEFFAMRPATTREAFCRRVGLDPAVPSVLYICSSEFVAPREVEFVTRWISHLRQSSDPLVRGCGILVRPHPAHPKPWKQVDLSAWSPVALWDEKETMNADQGLYDSLYHSKAVVGLNTSAMIEAGILDKPVLTLVLNEFAGGQEQTLHFHYLRAVNGGLLHEARSLDEHAQQVGELLRGDGHGDQARRFVERFVRPRGLRTPVTPIMVEEIERAGRARKRRTRAAAWHYPVRWGIRAALALRHPRNTEARRHRDP